MLHDHPKSMPFGIVSSKERRNHTQNKLLKRRRRPRRPSHSRRRRRSVCTRVLSHSTATSGRSGRSSVRDNLRARRPGSCRPRAWGTRPHRRDRTPPRTRHRAPSAAPARSRKGPLDEGDRRARSAKAAAGVPRLRVVRSTPPMATDADARPRDRLRPPRCGSRRRGSSCTRGTRRSGPRAHSSTPKAQ